MTDFKTEKQNRIFLATQQQRQASNPETSVWVEASAGTGKTKVLSDRVLRILLTGSSPSKILCLTYTKAAAVEMSNRITTRLSKWAVSDTPSLTSELQQLLGYSDISQTTLSQARKLFALVLDTPGGMKIQTIHSFCQEVLKRFPLEAKISPYFEVMDDRTAKEALNDIKTSLFQKIENNPECDTAKALQYITSKISETAFSKLMNSLTNNRNKLLKLLNKHSSLEDFIKVIAQRLKISPDISLSQIFTDFWHKTELKTATLFVEALQNGSDKDKEKSQTLRTAIQEQNYSLYHKIFLTDKNEPRKSPATKAVLSIFPEGEKFAYNEAIRLLSTDNLISSAELLSSTSSVLYLAQDLLNCYTSFKHLHSKMDYEDLIIRTEELLQNPRVADWVLYKLDGGLDHVLIDEAQDTNSLLWDLLHKALPDDGVNTVRQGFGDSNQAIYNYVNEDVFFAWYEEMTGLKPNKKALLAELAKQYMATRKSEFILPAESKGTHILVLNIDGKEYTKKVAIK